MRDIVVFSGSSNRGLAERICDNLGLLPGEIELKKFANGETSVRLCDSVREKDVFIIQSGSGKVNDNLMELLLTVSACKMASAKRITVICPLFFYSRQPESPASKKGIPFISKKDKHEFLHSTSSVPCCASDSSKLHNGVSVKSVLDHNATTCEDISEQHRHHPYKTWVAQSGTLIADLLVGAGADHIVTMDLHDPQFQGFFDIPVDNLFSKPLVQHYIVNYVQNYKDCVIVSPDAGGAKRAAAIADSLSMQFALIHKERHQRSTEKPVTAIGLGSCALAPTASTDNLIITSTNDGQSVASTIDDSSNTSCAGENVVATTMLVGDVQNKTCIIVDDLIDTGATAMRAARLLKEQGCSYVYVIVTHGIFSDAALEKVRACDAIDQFVTTNTVEQRSHIKQYGTADGKGLEVLDVSRIFSEAIRRINNGESISLIYDQGW
ncbi:hypothetical protein HII13_001333 [Brettanomyces bruxellensis]|nr:hypothetical protein HII13_001333 [Brettanomyces bruxellensis]